jgi:hypothetical protein
MAKFSTGNTTGKAVEVTHLGDLTPDPRNARLRGGVNVGPLAAGLDPEDACTAYTVEPSDVRAGHPLPQQFFDLCDLRRSESDLVIALTPHLRSVGDLVRFVSLRRVPAQIHETIVEADAVAMARDLFAGGRADVCQEHKAVNALLNRLARRVTQIHDHVALICLVLLGRKPHFAMNALANVPIVPDLNVGIARNG